MKQSKTITFESLMLIAGADNLRGTFDQFLVLALDAGDTLVQPPYKTVLEQTVDKFSKANRGMIFLRLLNLLIDEMKHRRNSAAGWDVLGEFYQEHLITDDDREIGYGFDTWQHCQDSAACIIKDTPAEMFREPIRILNSDSASGRIHFALAQLLGAHHIYSSITTNPICARMTALNFGLSGIKGEVLLVEDGAFRCDYHIFNDPMCIMSVTNKDKAPLWLLYEKQRKQSDA